MAIMWQGKYLEVHLEGTWEYAARRRAIGAAVILAVTDANEIVLVEQWRVAMKAPTIELPAGLIGDEQDGEAAAASAARELEEETGFTAATFEDLGEYATSAGMSSERFSLFAARGLVRTGPGGGVAEENIVTHVVPIAALHSFLAERRAAGCVIDCRLIVALGFVASAVIAA
jgi:ADP-ribose pyrophosphatase